jgi:DNA repair exonuclease SbcCD ATPase subunit
MRVDGLELDGYTNHKGTAVRFPSRGVMVVTGTNGSGKSSLLEAVGWAGWGQTLRGPSPVTAEGACTVNLAAGDVQVSRTRKGKGKVLLEWSTSGAAPTVYETPTKAQEALTRELGDFDRWRRTHVFTSVDAWGFADAPDAQRKLLLEQLLGLGCFDAALERCRVDLKAAVKEASAASMKAAEARVRCDEQERAVAGLEAAAGHVGAVGDIAALEVQVGRLYALAAVADDELQGFAREETAARAAETDARIESGVLERRVRALAGHSTCPVCEQKLPELLIHDLQRSMSEAVRVAEQRAAERAQRASDSAASVA